ncbi:MAG: hypothetical protein R3A10_06795 [Caldilineaceae bacterium]
MEGGGVGRAHHQRLRARAGKLAADVCLVSDTGILAPDQPVITYGLPACGRAR